MKILYICNNCSEKKYKELFEESNTLVFMPNQKYHVLLMNGIALNGIDVECISSLPINRDISKRFLIPEEDEIVDEVKYHYIRSINVRGLRHIMTLVSTFWRIFRSSKSCEYVITDCLNISNSLGAALACKLCRIPLITIVTDLPNFVWKKRFIKNINNFFLSLADGFIFLTEPTNKAVNLKKKPYIVLEGHVDYKMKMRKSEEKYEVINGKKIILYAGSIQKLYGIQMLVNGFLLADIPDSELWIYGDGDFKEELIEACANNSNVRYMGVKENWEIVDQETKVALLVNPRLSTQEYTKYSFPSKNMEYMASGTPLLTTKLPGMPEEYYRYVYLIEKETDNGIAEIIKKIFAETFQERTEKARLAKEFVMTNKTNVVQARKIIDFLRSSV